MTADSISADRLIDATHPFDYLDDFLGLARSGAAWLEKNHREDQDGIFWEYEPLEHTPGGHSLFSGDGGVALTFLQLWQETGEQHYLDVAIAHVQSLSNRWEHGRLTPELSQRGLAGLEKIPGGEWSYYLGAVGPAYVLLEVGRAADRRDLVDAGLAILDETIRQGHHADGLYWSGFPGILFDGGTLVVLAWAYDVFHKPEYAQAVEQGADVVLSKAIRHDVGLSWQGLVFETSGPGAKAEWPGFEFGTAGVGYLLARAYQVTGRQDFLDAALQGERYLQSIAVPVGDGTLIPYTTTRSDIFYLGNCHGPAGTSRLAQELFNITGDDSHEQWRTSLYRGLLGSGAPQTHSAGSGIRRRCAAARRPSLISASDCGPPRVMNSTDGLLWAPLGSWRGSPSWKASMPCGPRRSCVWSHRMCPLEARTWRAMPALSRFWSRRSGSSVARSRRCGFPRIRTRRLGDDDVSMRSGR